MTKMDCFPVALTTPTLHKKKSKFQVYNSKIQSVLDSSIAPLFQVFLFIYSIAFTFFLLSFSSKKR